MLIEDTSKVTKRSRKRYHQGSNALARVSEADISHNNLKTVSGMQILIPQ